MKKYFLGWTNIKWFVKEVSNLYSGVPSHFSKKRIESGVAFLIGQWGMVYFLLNNITEMSSSDIVLWSGVEFAVAGYMINQIEKSKKLKKDGDDGED